MDAVALTFAFSAGMASAFNPCGVALLPSYLAYLFLQKGHRPGEGGSHRAVLGVAAGALMTLGFLVVFVAAGFIVSVAAQVLRTVLPWLTIAIGFVLIGVGLLLFTGRSPSWMRLSLPLVISPTAGKSVYHSFFLYGLAFAIASLGCTLPIFMVVVAQTFSGGIVHGLVGFILYALGMGIVIMALSVTVALAKETAERWLQSILPLVEKIGAALIAAAGIYLVYYWLWGPGAGIR